MASGPSARHRQVPTVVQQEDNSSAAACLAMVLRAAGKAVPLSQVRSACHVDRDGVSPQELVAAAQGFGMDADLLQTTPDDLRSLEPPLIAQWQFTRYVVVEGWRGTHWVLHDPLLGRRDSHEDEFTESFTGSAVRLTPGAGFVADGRPRRPLSRIVELAGDLRAVIIYFCLVALLLVVPALIVPELIKLYSGGLTGGAGIAVWSATLGLVLAAAIQGLLQWLQGNLSVRLATKVSLRLDVELLHQLFQLPLDYFRRRSSASLAQRLGLVDQISAALSAMLLTGMTAALTAVAGIVALSVIDWVTGVTALLVAVLGAVSVSRLLARDRDSIVRILHENLRIGIEIGSVFEQIAAIKASGHQRTVIARGLDLHHRYLRAEQRLELRSLLVRIMPQLWGTLGTVAIAAAATQRVVTGEVTAAGLAAILALAALTITPTVTAVTMFERTQGLGAALDRLDDVLDARPSDEPPRPAPEQVLTGTVDVVGLAIAESPWSEPTLQDVSFQLSPGQRLAIVGPSGCGLTMLAEALAGVVPPCSGTVSFDGVAATDWGDHLVGQVTLVRQDERTFDFSWRDNITMFDPDVGDDAVQQAVRDAQLLSLVNSRDQGLDTRMWEYGGSMSAGQWQCVALARAFARDPAVLILDGALNALDGVTASAIDAAIRARGMTCIVLGHRSAWMAPDDQVIVIGDGGVVERGTHATLLAHGTHYQQLVTP